MGPVVATVMTTLVAATPLLAMGRTLYADIHNRQRAQPMTSGAAVLTCDQAECGAGLGRARTRLRLGMYAYGQITS